MAYKIGQIPMTLSDRTDIASCKDFNRRSAPNSLSVTAELPVLKRKASAFLFHAKIVI